MKLRTLICISPAIVFFAFIFYMMICTFTGTVKNTVKNMELSFHGFINLSDEFEEVLQENFSFKNDFINMNGYVTRILGINSLNERQKLANGYLAEFESTVDTTSHLENLIQLNEFLAERGIDFLYLLVPTSASIYDAEFSPGYSSSSSENIDSMISALSKGKVNTIDMNAMYEENGWDTEEVFFKTDHHWKPEAALEAVRCTMENFSDREIASYNEEWLKDESWTITVLEEWFLGSHGKRTGSMYAGTDDISIYEPDFETNYSYSGLSQGSSTWSYYDNILDLSYADKRDYFNSVPYHIYMYDDFPIRTTINTEAWNNQRVLLMGDSFKLPYEYFLTTQFQEVYTIDLRLYEDGTLAQYVEEISPDIVIMCTYEGHLSRIALYEFGIEEYETALLETSVSNSALNLGDIGLDAQENNDNNFEVVCSNLEPGQTYTLTIDATSMSGGVDSYTQMTLQDLSTNEAVYNRYFKSNCEDIQKWIFSIPENENDTYAVYLYAGTSGHTSGVEVTATQVQLYEGIVEN
ncbi:MAG: hypothetical protein LUE98_19920 [Tannerellaceae bacterium]|nr:hypothetical protein [Tannerellaceae bacterium]